MRSLAFMRAALNIGFTLGALLGGLALATNSDAVIRVVPLVTARDPGAQRAADHAGCPTRAHDEVPGRAGEQADHARARCATGASSRSRLRRRARAPTRCCSTS